MTWRDGCYGRNSNGCPPPTASDTSRTRCRLLHHEPLDLGAAPAVPALVFTGEHDVYTRPELCHEVASAFESATFTTIRSADHLFHLECFDATLALVAWFLRGEPLDPTRYAAIESWCLEPSALSAAS